MINNYSLKIFLPLIITVLCIRCGSDDNSSPLSEGSEEEINLEEARLTDFPFQEIEYLDIEITQPTIVNNEEVEEGEIIITLPHTVTSLLLTLESVNIDTEKYNIFPSVGSLELYSETESVNYQITSTSNPDINIHYNVRVIVAPNPDPKEEKLSISSFRLLANDGVSQADLRLKKEALSIQSVDSLLFTLFPRSVDFSDLTPTIEYQGPRLEYRINDEEFRVYPVDTEEKIDFKYPNTVDFRVSDATNSTAITYRIIVDTTNPIVFNQPELNIPDLFPRDTYNGIGIGTWTNQGNYPITDMSPNQLRFTLGECNRTELCNIFNVELSSNEPLFTKPDQDGVINIVVTNNAPASEEYETIAIFSNLKFDENTWRIINAPADEYRSDIGYIPVQLTMRGIVN